MRQIITYFSKVVERYFLSFDNEPIGYSRTKLVAYAFAAITMIASWCWIFDTLVTAAAMRAIDPFRAGEAWEMLPTVLTFNVTTILTLLGVKAYFKKKEPEKKRDTEKELS